MAITASGSRAILASDSLWVLQTAVGSRFCPLCICDVNRSRAISATDALLVLQFGVGQPVTLRCFACVLPPADAFASYSAEKEANDAVGGMDGALENGATFVTGVLGLGFDFDGVDDRIVIPHDPGQNVGTGFTISAWVNPASHGHGSVVAQKRSPSNVGGYTFEMTHSPFGPNQGLQFVLWLGGGSVLVQTPPDMLPLGAWRHVVAIYDGVTMRIFVDGVERGSRAETRVADATTEPVVVGRNVVTGTAWHGQIDELQFFDRALTDFEIRSLYLQGREFDVAVSTPGLVRMYRAEGNANDSAADQDGVLKNGASFGRGQIGVGFALDGVDDFMETTATPLGTATSATVTAWIQTVDTNGAILSLAHGVVEDELLLQVNSGRVAVFNHKSSSNFVSRASDSTVNDGQWRFVAGVLNGGGSEANLEIYVDGVQENGTTNTVGAPTDIVDTTPRSARIGWRSNELAVEAFEGSIDEVWVFDRALSATEIQGLFNAGRGGQP